MCQCSVTDFFDSSKTLEEILISSSSPSFISCWIRKASVGGFRRDGTRSPFNTPLPSCGNDLSLDIILIAAGRLSEDATARHRHLLV